MRIRLTTGVQLFGAPQATGSEHEVPEPLGAMLVGEGRAVRVAPPASTPPETMTTRDPVAETRDPKGKRR